MSVVFITGCSTGIGRELARVCAEAGDRVFATMRDPSMAGDLEGLDEVTILALDVTDDKSVQKAVDDAIRSAGRLDVIINNAGIDTLGAVEDISFDRLRAIMETNFFGALRVTRAALPTLRDQQSGTIVMVTSMASIFSSYGEGSYSASKRALEAAAETLQLETKRWGIRVQVIRPGYVATPIGARSHPGSESPTDSPYRDLIRLHGEQDMAGVAGGEPAHDVASEIREAYTGGSNAFYVPVTKMSHGAADWRKEQDDRKLLEQVAPEFEWWANGDEAPS